MDPFSASSGYHAAFEHSLIHPQYTSKYINSDYHFHSQQQISPANSSTSPRSLNLESDWPDYVPPDQLHNYSTDNSDLSAILQIPRYSLPQAERDEIDSRTFNQHNYPAFKAEIERSRKQKRESARCNAADQVQNDVTGLATPRSTESASSNGREDWVNMDLVPEESSMQWTNFEDDTLFLDDVEAQYESTLEDTAHALEEENKSEASPTDQGRVDIPEFSPTISQIPKKRTRKRKVKTTEEIEVKRTAFLFRNRQAASKCRGKKKEWMKNLEDDFSSQRSVNGELKKEYERLTEEVRMLRMATGMCEAEDGNAASELGS